MQKIKKKKIANQTFKSKGGRLLLSFKGQLESFSHWDWSWWKNTQIARGKRTEPKVDAVNVDICFGQRDKVNAMEKCFQQIVLGYFNIHVGGN